MQEIFDQLKRTTKNNLVLLDTCFIIDVFHHNKEKELLAQAQKRELAITSFNSKELVHVIHKIKDKSVQARIRKFFKENDDIKILEIPVQPGNHEQELHYVQAIDPCLAQDIPDHSDAVLIAAAVQTRSNVLTKDKHHLFTVTLENYLNTYHLKVEKTFSEL